MKKKILIAFIAVIGIILVISISSNDKTFLEKRAEYAMNYTNSNLEDLDIYKEGMKLVDTQNASIDAIKKTYKDGNYTIDNPLVTVDPYKQNNLAAYIIFNSDEKVSYSYVVEAKDGSNYPFTYSSDTLQSGDIVIPVVGLYEDYANKVTITLTDKDGKESTSTVTVQTEKSVSKYHQGAVNTAEAEKELGLKLTAKQAAATGSDLINVTDATVNTTILDNSVLDVADGFILSEDYDVYDFDGNLRFSSLQGAGNNPLKLNNGHYLVTSYDHVMYEMDFMGKVYQFYIPPVSDENGEELVFHHDAVVSPDGKYVYALAGYNKLEDIKENKDQYFRETLIIKYDRKTGKSVDVFDYADDFADEPQSQSTGSKDDPLHMNSIDYYADKNQLIVSMKNQSQIVGINAKNGKVQWILKDPQAVTKDQNKDLLLKADGNILYTSGNHSVFVMNTEKYNSEGNDLYLSAFDNRFCVNDEQNPVWSKIGEKTTCAKSKNSSMVIYHINLADKTVETVETITPDDNRWSNIRSSVFTDMPGLYQIHYADMAAPDGSAITHSDLYVTNEEGKVLSHTTFDGMTNVYRSRLINKDEIGTSLQANIDSL